MTLPALEPSPAEVVLELQGPFSLPATLGIIPRGAMDPTVRLAADRAWLAFNTPGGPATLLLRISDDGGSPDFAWPSRPATGYGSAALAGGNPSALGSTVHARAWGPGATLALRGVPALLGRDDDWSGFDEPDFQATLPRLVTETRRRHRSLRLPATGRMIDAIIPAVLEQKVTTIEAKRGYRYLLRRFGQPAPGTHPGGPVPVGLTVPPTGAEWARIPSWEWHKAGVGPQRSATIMRALRSAAALERLAGLSAVDAAGKLQTISGIGRWTAAEVTQRTHGDPDAVAVGDYHLAAFVGWALIGKPVDDDGMLELLEPWRGHRQRVVRMLGLSGFRKPMFGARMTIQDHRRH
ncbi:MAG TPA: 3-methyladenine DNA glycosylase [Micrococcaceae bacterium]|jgi:3-methyladenine DNA glycosylase/8-oxoguanine DNA glycosylase|nr:3-methyladenine DNA glycosylase [Micrococcaceae bacterium]